jgi:hypothetical protein
MKRATLFLCLTSLLVMLAVLVSVASAQSADSSSTAQEDAYELGWWTADDGAATSSTGGGYTLGCSVGQPDAGVLSGGAYTLEGGFWGGAVVEYRVLLLLVFRGY